jgi:hypothetical protein
MTGVVTVVDVQWALHGKAARPPEYRVLACSAGDLAMVNFADAISRFQLGTVDTLPQVTVSYLQPARAGGNYLALAIHKAAGPGQAAVDEEGRQISYTNYFCMPYAPLAAAGITYRAMHEAVRDLRLPVENGPTLRVPFTGQAYPPPVIDPLAMRVAALLLTSRSVCVLQAESVTAADRLVFIDTVMALLPYGFRARMTAATWTRATYRDHHFRLFFSSSPRASGRGDHVVSWGRPETAVITPADGAAHEYLTWLEDTLSRPLARLNRLTDGIGFGGDPGGTALKLAAQAAPRPPLGGS